MAVTQDQPAPYAPSSAIIGVIERYRQRGLPTPINAEVLGRASVSDSLIPRTLQALQSLDLIDEDGRPTQTLENIRLAPEAEYKGRLKEWLNSAYADVLSFVDPANDDEVKVRDAFRSYRPVGQQPRMVSLFLGLYAAAGVTPEKPSQARRPRQSRPLQRQPQRSQAATSSVSKNISRKSQMPDGPPHVPAPLAGLLSTLPPEGGGWTQNQRDKFVATFGTVLDFCFPIVRNGSPSEPMSGEEDDE